MRRYFPALVTALLTAVAALGQSPARPLLSTNVGDPEAAAGESMAVTSGLDPAIHPRVWATGEYLLGYTRPQGVPLLVGTVPDNLVVTNGRLPDGVSPTPLFPTSSRLRFGTQSGGRARVGGNLTDTFGADLGGFALSSGSDGATFVSSGSPTLLTGYTRPLDGSSQLLITASPGKYSGTVSVSADTRAWGLDANARFDTYRLYSDRTELLVGVRYVNLSENLTYAVRSDFAGGGVITVRDEFRARNDLYVGQAGFESRWRLGRFTFDLMDKFGVGGASQRIEIFGRNTLTGLPDQDSGLYAQPGISGVHQRDKLVATNEFGVALGFRPVERVTFTVGYNILWVSSVVRPGPAIDPVINDSGIRFVANPPADPTSARPTFSWERATTDAWIRGLTLGVSVGF